MEEMKNDQLIKEIDFSLPVSALRYTDCMSCPSGTYHSTGAYAGMIYCGFYKKYFESSHGCGYGPCK